MFSGLFGLNGKLSKGGSKRAAKKARKNLKHRLHMEPLEERRLMVASVSVAAFDASAAEGSADDGTFRITRTVPESTELTVFF